LFVSFISISHVLGLKRNKNDAELKSIEEKIEDAVKNAGDTEVSH
jgi:hypothetical protein